MGQLLLGGLMNIFFLDKTPEGSAESMKKKQIQHPLLNLYINQPIPIIR